MNDGISAQSLSKISQRLLPGDFKKSVKPFPTSQEALCFSSSQSHKLEDKRLLITCLLISLCTLPTRESVPH